MRLGTTLLAGAACTQAVNIQLYSASQLEAEWNPFEWIGGAFEDIGEWTVGAIEDIGSWTGGAFEDALDWTVGAFEDVGEFAVDAVEWTGNAFEDAFEWTENAFEDAVEWTGNAFEDAVDWTGGALEDAIDWTGGALEDVGEWTVGAIVDIGEWTINATVDVWDWVSEAENWAALGQTLLEGTWSLVSFDFKGAATTFLDGRSYSADGRDEIAEQELLKAKYEKFMDELPGKCIDHMANVEAREIKEDENEEIALQKNLVRNYGLYEENWNNQTEPIIIKHNEKYDAAKALRDEKIQNYTKAMENRAGYCATEDQPLGHLFDIPYRVNRRTTIDVPMTKTQAFSHNMKRFENLIWNRILDPEQVDRELCEEEDCFHRCSGTDLYADCAMCADTIAQNAKNFNSQRVLNKVRAVCSKCQYPVKPDPAMPEPLEYIDPVIKPALKSFEEYKEDKYPELKAQREEARQERENNPTPEEIKNKENEAKFEAQCAKHVDEWKNWNDPRTEEL